MAACDKHSYRPALGLQNSTVPSAEGGNSGATIPLLGDEEEEGEEEEGGKREGGGEREGGPGEFPLEPVEFTLLSLHVSLSLPLSFSFSF